MAAVRALAQVAVAWALTAGVAAAQPAAAEPRPSTALPEVLPITPPLAMPGLDRSRTLRIRLPEDYARSAVRYPVIYMHDGQNLFDEATAYAGEWGVDESMRELSRTHGFDAIVVGIDNGAERRLQELSPWPHPEHGPGEGDAFLQWIVEIVKPFVDMNWRTLPDPANTAIVGSSMGGLAAHAAIHRRPDVFGKAGVFSPSYGYSGQAFAVARTVRLPPQARLYLYAGGREGPDMARDAEAMHALLRERLGDDRVMLRIVPDAGHDEAAWRAEFPRAVRWLFGVGADERSPRREPRAAQKL